MKSFFVMATMIAATSFAQTGDSLEATAKKMEANMVEGQLHVGVNATQSMITGGVRRGCLYIGDFRDRSDQLQSGAGFLYTYLKDRNIKAMPTQANPLRTKDDAVVEMWEDANSFVELIQELRQTCDHVDGVPIDKAAISELSILIKTTVANFNKAYLVFLNNKGK